MFMETMFMLINCHVGLYATGTACNDRPIMPSKIHSNQVLES